jgi:uncharacterized protein
VDDASLTLSPALAADDPFTRKRWSGWLVFIIAFACIGAFVFVQLVLTVFILLHSPDVMQNGLFSPALHKKLTDPNYFITLLNAKNLWLLSVVSEGVLALGTLFLARIMLEEGSRALGFRGRPAPAQLATGFGVGLLLFVASTAVGAVMTKIFGPHPQPQAMALLKHHGIVDFLLDFTAVAMVAPIGEEVFFRGFIFTGLAQRMGPYLAMVISAFLFGAAHLEKWVFLPLFVVGVGLAWLYYRTRNLWVNIIAHGTVNAVSLVLAFTVPQLVKS